MTGLLAKGKKYVFLSNIDNLGATVDLVSLVESLLIKTKTSLVKPNEFCRIFSSSARIPRLSSLWRLLIKHGEKQDFSSNLTPIDSKYDFRADVKGGTLIQYQVNQWGSG
jgi:hypothetical protein